MYSLEKEECQVIEKAIKFMASKHSRNDKPVVFHSLKVAFYLLDKQYPTKVVIAAILHDLLEDSNLTSNQIKRKFSVEVTRLVESVSFNPEIKDPKERYQEMFERSYRAGKDSLVIKAADIYNNSHYYHLVKDVNKRKELINKVKYFLDLSKDKIGKIEVWQDLDS